MMINRLRRKLIIVTMSSLWGVLAFLVLTVNVINYHSMIDNVSEIFSVLFEHGGQFPRSDKFLDNQDNKVNKKWINQETPYETRFFSIQVDSQYNIVYTNTGNITAISSEDANLMASTILQKDKSTGFYGIYRYEIQDYEEGKLVVFVDCNLQLKTLQNFFFSSLFIAFIAWLTVLCLIIIFSKRAIRPVVESYEKQKRFITDSSHEIKTPLAIIQANTELIEMLQGENEWTQGIINQVERLSDLTKSMTSLARMDEEGNSFEKGLFSFSDIVTEACEAFSSVAICQNKKLSMDIGNEMQLMGNEVLISQLLSILLDNALKYSKTFILVTASYKRGKIYLHVKNDCSDIEKGKLDFMFERFYRGDLSRNNQVAGFGIGLSLAKSIVEEHRGKITALSEDGTSVEIIVSL